MSVPKIFITSDTHFGHKALWEKHNRQQGFEDVILENLLKLEGDMIIHLGDFAWKHDEVWTREWRLALQRVKRKILVRGNHDYQSNSWYLDHGWDFVCDSFSGKFFGKHIVFTHEPIKDLNPFAQAEYNIHGHLHGKVGRHRWDDYKDFYDETFHIDVAPDDNQYRAYDLEKLLMDVGAANPKKVGMLVA